MKEVLLNKLKLLIKSYPVVTLEAITYLLKQFLIAVLAIFFVLSLYPISPSFKLVTVDITTLSENQLKALSQNTLSETELKKAIRNYAQHLEQILEKLSKVHHWIILPKEAVIHGAEDFTEAVQALLNEAME